MSFSFVSRRNRAGRSLVAVWLVLPALSLTSCGKSSSPATPTPIPTPDPPAAQGCPTGSNLAPAGTLVKEGAGFTFSTSTNWRIHYEPSKLDIVAPTVTKDTLEFWGGIPGDPWMSGNHENVNGKHVKDRAGNIRTVRLPDGALVTMTAAGAQAPLVTVSLYEGGQSHTIQASTMTLTHSCAGDLAVATARERAEPDGETASLTITAGGGVYYANEYVQGASASGEPLDKVPSVQRIAETGGPANPNQVVDYFD
jgi:hypothetical protein